MDESLRFSNLDLDKQFLGNRCPRKPDPGAKFVRIPGSFVEGAFVQIPESCTFDSRSLDINCGAGCEPAPPPAGGECSYEIKIKTSCAAFSGNPFGTVSVSISDDVSGGVRRQLAGHIESFRELDNPGVADFTRCTLAEFSRTGTCISAWSVDYVEVSNKYGSKKFDLHTTLRPSHETGIGDFDTVLFPKHFSIPGVRVSIPERCEFTRGKNYGDGYLGSLNCECKQANNQARSYDIL